MSTETTTRAQIRQATLAELVLRAAGEHEGVAVRFKPDGQWVDVSYAGCGRSPVRSPRASWRSASRRATASRSCPTPDFQDAGRADLYSQVHRQGGARHVAAVLGLPFTPPRLDRRLSWTEERIRTELRSNLNGKDTWPTCKQFAADGHPALRHAVREFGGAERWASELGVRLPRHQRARPKWSYLRLKEELTAFTRDRRDWPAVADFEAAGRMTLYHAIMRSGSRAQLAADLGLQLPAGLARIRSPARWTDEAIEAALDQLLEGRTSWPSWTDFREAGLTHLYAVLLQPGAREWWARQYGIKPPRRRSRHAT